MTGPAHVPALPMTAALCLVCGLLSPLIVATGRSFMVASVSHSTLLGLAVAFLVVPGGDPRGTYLAALAVTVAISLGLAAAGSGGRLPFDSLVGVFFSVSMAAGILVAHAGGIDADHDLFHYLFGDVLLVAPFDAAVALANLAAAAAATLPFLGKWALFATDGARARAQGQNTALFHYGLTVLVASTVVSALKVTGVVLVGSMLLVPGVFALKAARGLRALFAASVAFSLASGAAGLGLALRLGSPSGATVACFQFAMLLAALAVLGCRRAWGKPR